MMRVGTNKFPVFASEYDIVQIIFDSRDEFDNFIDSIDGLIDLEKNAQADISFPHIANLVKMLNVHLTEEDDGTVWTYVLSMHMPAVFLAFTNCISIFFARNQYYSLPRRRNRHRVRTRKCLFP